MYDVLKPLTKLCVCVGGVVGASLPWTLREDMSNVPPTPPAV